jgi:transposase
MLTTENFYMIRDLYHQGLNISQIAQETGYHRNTVRKYLAAPVLGGRDNIPFADTTR